MDRINDHGFLCIGHRGAMGHAPENTLASVGDDAASASTLGSHSVHPSVAFVDRRFVDGTHARGLRVFAFTVGHPGDIGRMKELCVDGIFTNYPERVLQLFPSQNIMPGWR